MVPIDGQSGHLVRESKLAGATKPAPAADSSRTGSGASPGGAAILSVACATAR